jgi:hypothetical protein
MVRDACRRSRKRLPRPADPASQTFDNTRVHAVTVPTTLAQAPVDVILVARTGTAAGFRACGCGDYSSAIDALVLAAAGELPE